MPVKFEPTLTLDGILQLLTSIVSITYPYVYFKIVKYHKRKKIKNNLRNFIDKIIIKDDFFNDKRYNISFIFDEKLKKMCFNLGLNFEYQNKTEVNNIALTYFNMNYIDFNKYWYFLTLIKFFYNPNNRSEIMSEEVKIDKKTTLVFHTCFKNKEDANAFKTKLDVDVFKDDIDRFFEISN